MLDLKRISDDPEAIAAQLATRGGDIDIAELLVINEERKRVIQAYDSGRHEQRQLSEVFRAKGGSVPPEDIATARERLKSLGAELKSLEHERAEIEAKIEDILLHLPNLPHESVPRGASEADNVEVSVWGEKPSLDFEPQDHVALGESLGILDFAAAAKISGARFAVYRGAGAALERALMMFMLDVHTREHEYEEVLTPFLVRPASMVGTSQLPKFADDAFQVDDDLYLIPTAEVPVTNLYREQILEATQLPIRNVAFSACFRREAGSYGKDTRGLTRLHQFQKVELVQVTRPEDGEQALEDLTGHAEVVLQRLGLHYRKMVLCTGDLGFGACKTYDLEVWLPAQGTYREISSCSVFGDFQARRAGIRYRPAQGEKPRYCHTINGSGLAIGRTVMAILEVYQQPDGSVVVPPALRSYMGGLEVIAAKPGSA